VQSTISRFSAESVSSWLTYSYIKIYSALRSNPNQ